MWMAGRQRTALSGCVVLAIFLVSRCRSASKDAEAQKKLLDALDIPSKYALEGPRPVEPWDVLQGRAQLSRNTSPGADDIPNKVWKHCPIDLVMT